MEYLTATVLSGITYDLLKKGLQISTDSLRRKLRNWMISDEDLKLLTERINNIDQLEDLNETAICKKLDADLVVHQILVNTQKDNSISQLNQNHSGRGDNIAGDKVINQNNY